MEEVKPKYYDEKVKERIMRYRSKNIEKYNEFSRNYYHTKKQNEEWLNNWREKCREANKKYREKKKEGKEPKKRGRPRKDLGEILGDLEKIELKSDI
jgi:hypothetical protein